VIVMAPLLGGKLASGLPKKAADIFRKADPGLTPTDWALRWLWNQPEVTVVLSGMSTEDQLVANVNTAAGSKPHMLDERQMGVFHDVREAMRGDRQIPCTGCNYCMPCPRGVNIPVCFNGYNTSYAIGFVTGMKQYVMGTGLASARLGQGAMPTGQAGGCTECGQCEKNCPQGIKIRKELAAVKKRMEPFWTKYAFAAIDKVKKRV